MASKPADDAKCKRCDDSGIVAVPGRRFWEGAWATCTCRAGAIVLEQQAKRT